MPTATKVTWEYGCVRCQRYHREGDELYDSHVFFQSKHGLREVRKVVRTQATLTLGGRTVLVERNSISVFPANNFYRSWAAWVVTAEATAAKPWLIPTPAFPAEVDAFLTDILEEGAPLQPLCDWLIDNGPAELAAELQAMMAAA